MYSRKANSDGSPLTFGVSGKLWNGVLVMYDRDTETHWTQLDGRAIRGELLGERLEHVDSVFTTWATWVDAHPETLVLAKPPGSRGRGGSSYASYFADPDALFVPELAEGLGGIAPKDLVFGVFEGDEAWAVEASVLEARGVVNAVVGGRPVAVVRAANGFVHAVDRRLGERFTILDRDGGADPGEALRDVLTGEVLRPDRFERIRVDRAFWYAWSRSHPGSTVLAGREDPPPASEDEAGG